MLRKRGLTGAVAALLLTTAGSVMAPAALATATGNRHALPAPRVNWNGCDLSYANLNDALLPHASLVGTDLHGASLIDANITNANLGGTDLRETFLTGATLTGADLGGVTWQHTSCPDGTNSNNDGGTCMNNL